MRATESAEPPCARAAVPRPPLVALLADARRHTDELFAILTPAALYERAVAERHRFIFYLGHLEAFDWNLCRSHLLGADAGALDQLFAFGIDPDPHSCAKLPRDCAADWPSVATVLEYRAERRALIDRQLAAVPAQLLQVAIEHRYMHAETLCYLMHWLPVDYKRALVQPAARAAAGAAEAPGASAGYDRPPPVSSPIVIPAGRATLGRRHGFGWDNEFPEHTVEVPAFAIDRYKVTNSQYLRFVQDGGPPPLFWQPAESAVGFTLRCMFGEVPLPMSWPVYVTHEQASAYAAWAGAALPTEAEFHRAAYGTPPGQAGQAGEVGEREYPWAATAPPEGPPPECGNFDFQRWDPVPVDASPRGDSAFGVAQLVGNGWEWTGTPFLPFTGFAPFAFYPGYSADFFDRQHFVLKGGSARTARCLLRRSFRNWYRTGYRYAYAGFRCVHR